jgi:predicted enzyme related to lactoylglutathione lyase
VNIQINIDCDDLDRMVAFYTAALDYEPFGTDGERYRSILPKSGDGPKLVFQKVPERKVVKNRVHLDLIVGSEIEAEVDRFLTLGATRISEARLGGPGCEWIIVADPEGNELCICTS